jgi:hypothetical protein
MPSRTSPSTNQSLQKNFHLSHADKIELENISSPSENKNNANAQTNTTQTKTVKLNNDNGLQTRWTEGLLPVTAVWRNGVFSASYDSFVVGSSAVLRLNFSAKNPPPSPSPKPLYASIDRPIQKRKLNKQKQ